MKKLLFLFLIICNVVYAEGFFDDRGVWHAVENSTLAHGIIKSFGIIDISDREEEINVFVYGTTPDDSLVVKLQLLGLMSASLADTNKSVEIFNETVNLDGGGVAFSDTLQGDEMFPYLFGKLTNEDTDSTLTYDLWIYMKPRI